MRSAQSRRVGDLMSGKVLPSISILLPIGHWLTAAAHMQPIVNKRLREERSLDRDLLQTKCGHAHEFLCRPPRDR